jgi:hypothetical protein
MNSSEQISGIPEDEIFGIIGVPLGLDQNVVWILHTDPAHVLPLLHGISYSRRLKRNLHTGCRRAVRETAAIE